MGGPGLEILHVDMDAFYAAVEVRADPGLAGCPVIVGGTGRRGVVASCSYEARAFGVHSAMPSTRARRLCPEAVFLPGDFGAYVEVSRQLHRVLGCFTPMVEGIALDEAFLDVAGAHRLFGSSRQIAQSIREQVLEDLGLGCSVGVGRSKLVAKLASRAAKPRATWGGTVPGPGVVVVEADAEAAFLHPLPVSAIWGVGPATATRLGRLGVTTVGQMASLPLASLVSLVGSAQGRILHELSRGHDRRPVEPNRVVKSVGHEETYANDHCQHATLRRQLVRLGDGVASRLRGAGLVGRTVTLKVRFADFSTITRAQTVTPAIDNGRDLARVGIALLDHVDVRPGVRLLGLSVSNLAAAASADGRAPVGLGPSGWAEVSAAVEAVRARFGPAAVAPASLVGSDGVEVKRPGDTQWGPGN